MPKTKIMEESKQTKIDFDSGLGESQEIPQGGIVERYVGPKGLKSILKKFMLVGIEMRGLEPIPPEKRTHTKYYNVLTLFGGSFFSLLPLSIGTTPTLVFGLSFHHAVAMILTMQLLFILPTLYILTLAPRLGMRQSVQFRYVFGKFPNAIVSLIIIIEIGIFGILAAVGGAECLAAVSPGSLPIKAAVGIILAVAFCIAFVGYSAIHLVCQYIWIPNIVCLLTLAACAGSQLYNQAPGVSRGSSPYLATAALCAGNMATWGTIIGDYTCYMPAKAPRLRLVFYCFTGLYVPFSLMMIFGAAIGGAIPVIPSWSAAYDKGSIGGVLAEILIHTSGGFGKFCLVILGFSIVSTSARDMYSISLLLVATVPWLRRIPRVLLLVLTTGTMAGVGIQASSSFLPSLSTLVAIAGYITGPVISVFLVEWFVFRRANVNSIDPAIWDDAAALPMGLTAVFATLAPWGLIVLSMDSVWYVGPIAARVGDLAWEVGTAASIILYIPLRAAEIKYRGRL